MSNHQESKDLLTEVQFRPGGKEDRERPFETRAHNYKTDACLI